MQQPVPLIGYIRPIPERRVQPGHIADNRPHIILVPLGAPVRGGFGGREGQHPDITRRHIHRHDSRQRQGHAFGQRGAGQGLALRRPL